MEIQLWREILNPYELAVEELTVKFDHLVREHKASGLYSPIEQVDGRVKAISSILEKAQKKHIPLDEIEEKIEDIAGIRIICQFVEDINKVVELIKQRNDMEVKSEKDYITNMKSSGYRSYHMIVYYQIQTLKGPKKLQVEIQIRTLAMNFWATIEHSLQYKYKKNMPEHIRSRLTGAADAIILLDKEMSLVRNEIMDAQNSFQIKANIVADILNNIQNLYKVANKREVLKIQDEFYRIYEYDDIEQLERFNKQLDIIAEGYRAQNLSDIH
ncbi:GTP pyrophosphokinase [Anaerobium acetethylicum]|uniref:Putative GTP pyrophosphokinase n=1 Tax=Anaerobium acetethylicum TaxID=1619234 RepID=A0A1D3TNQ0_9FIRM|nr:GTP pyrophosphokinase family protein [Anaerobium acetethylicum]SCP94963.1 putative GTP pyrophosphokinase [Anaerobium acetethylicum]